MAKGQWNQGQMLGAAREDDLSRNQSHQMSVNTDLGLESCLESGSNHALTSRTFGALLTKGMIM